MGAPKMRTLHKPPVKVGPAGTNIYRQTSPAVDGQADGKDTLRAAAPRALVPEGKRAHPDGVKVAWGR